MKTYKAKDYTRIISTYEAVIKERQAKHDAKMQELAAQFMQQLDAGNAVAVSELEAKMRQCKREHAAYLLRSTFVLPYCKALVRKLEAQHKSYAHITAGYYEQSKTTRTYIRKMGARN